MKKIAFFMSSMNMGGIEKSLHNLINAILQNENFYVDLYLIKEDGVLLKTLNSTCHIKKIPISERDVKLLLAGGFKNQLIQYAKKLDLFSLLRIFVRRVILKKLDYDLIDFEGIIPIKTNYDYAICCNSHMPFLVKFVSTKVSAKRKFLFIHGDFKKNKYHINYLEKYLVAYSKFVCVSNDLAAQFTKLNSKHCDNTTIIHNLIDTQDIHKKSLEIFNNYRTSSLKILTVGNFTKPKNNILAIKSAKALSKMFKNFEWKFCGNGPMLNRCEKYINKHNLKKYISLELNVTNPYPYFKDCDIYVQTSKSEGYCTAIIEAMVFNKKIVATNVPGIHEILTNYNIGRLTGKKPKQIAESIMSLIDSKANSNFDINKFNDEIIEKLNCLFK